VTKRFGGLIASIALLATLLPQLASVATAGGAASKSSNESGKVWKDVPLPFTTEFKVPKGVTEVKASAQVAAGATVSVSLFNADTGRPRCYPVIVKTWTSSHTGAGSCDALTAVDRPGETWRLNVTGGTSASSVTLRFVKGKVTGPASKLNLNKLSMPQYKMGPTKDFMFESFDGTLLHTEITRPVTKKKVPTVIVSSPYFAGEGPYSPDLVNDWGPRGYAILNIDVRGFNESKGCVEVWGPNEQKDQKAIVEWAAKQPWSDGRVALVGKSYVGTTTLEGAVEAPKALKAIIAIAPVASAYEDWHYGGVPNGEQVASPLAGYQVLEGSTPDGSGVDAIENAANGMCDPTLSARASDPRAIYDNFYKERDFSARAKDIKAAVMYVHGYEDQNVKISVADEFFNAVRSPKLGLFGHWDHIWPPRPDAEVFFLAWLDQYLKGKNIGLGRLPNALVENNNEKTRGFEQWPTPKAKTKNMYLDFDKSSLADVAKEGSAQLLLDSTGARSVSGNVNTELSFARKLKSPFELAGTPRLSVKGTLAGAENGYLAAYLFDEAGETSELISFGMFNIAHRNGHDKYEPVTPTETLKFDLRLLTTDHVFKKGHTLRLEVRAARPATDSSLSHPSEPGILTIESGPKGTRLLAPSL
jgi:predicted acyl esterase/uncharacterized membrane protein